VGNRPVKNSRDYPDLPADFYSYSGLFGQRVTIFPSQDLVIVRLGQDPGLVPAGQASWEHELYTRTLGSITDQKWDAPGEAPRVNEEREDVDTGFGNAIFEPDQYSQGAAQDDLPPAGPARARAAILTATRKRGVVKLRVACPPVAKGGCKGSAKITGKKAKRYDLAGGKAKTLIFKLSKRARKRRTLTGTAVNEAAAGGTTTKTEFSVAG
jgi:hypothetical protein